MADLADLVRIKTGKHAGKLAEVYKRNDKRVTVCLRQGAPWGQEFIEYNTDDVEPISGQ